MKCGGVPGGIGIVSVISAHASNHEECCVGL
jgi:hypothetical protein